MYGMDKSFASGIANVPSNVSFLLQFQRIRIIGRIFIRAIACYIIHSYLRLKLCTRNKLEYSSRILFIQNQYPSCSNRYAVY